MGALFSSPPSAPAIPVPPPMAAPPTPANSSSAATAQNQRAKAAAAAGMAGSDGTITSGSPEGLAAPPTAQATLLGGTK